jgi:hypothetical protein
MNSPQVVPGRRELFKASCEIPQEGRAAHVSYAVDGICGFPQVGPAPAGTGADAVEEATQPVLFHVDQEHVDSIHCALGGREAGECASGALQNLVPDVARLHRASLAPPTLNRLGVACVLTGAFRFPRLLVTGNTLRMRSASGRRPWRGSSAAGRGRERHRCRPSCQTGPLGSGLFRGLWQDECRRRMRRAARALRLTVRRCQTAASRRAFGSHRFESPYLGR